MNANYQYNKPTDNLLRLSANSEEEITKIKHKYNFKEDFDLVKALNYLPTRLCLTSSCHMPSAEKIQRSIDTMNKLVKRLQNTWGKFDINTKDYFNITLVVILFKQNYSILNFEDIMNNLSIIFSTNAIPVPDSIKIKRIIDIINKLIGRLQDVWKQADINIKYYLNESLYITLSKQKCSKLNFEYITENLYCACQLALKTPCNSWPNIRSKQKKFISFLVQVFKHGTNKKPTCYWNENKDRYIGSFYDFLCDIESLLKQDLMLNISLTDCSLGKYTETILSWHREEHYA